MSTSVAGTTTTTSGGSVSYTVGEIAIQTTETSSGTASEGVQQAYEISSTVGVTEYDEITLEVEAYPNPTTDYLTLDVKDFSLTELDYVLYDMTGKVLITRKINQSNTIIEMMDFPEAMYFLKVSNGKSVMKTFKIIKN